MAITNKVKVRSRPALFITLRKTYSNTGALINTYGPFTSTTTTTTHPYSGSGCYGGHRSRSLDYYSDSAWRSVLASQGYLPTRALTHEFNFVQGENWSSMYRHPARWYERVELSGGYLNPPQRVETSFESKTTILDPFRTALKTDAKYKALSKARDMRLSAPVTFQEMDKTVRMIRDTAKTLGSAYTNFRKGRWGKAARDLGITKPSKTAANHWLAYQYGWRPLLSDAVGASTLLYDFFERERPPRTTVRAAVKGEDIDGGGSFGNHPLITGYTQKIAWTRRSRATAGLLLELEYSSAALAAQLGVGLFDPLLTAWELTPFSFVFDWFVDVGSWLEARSSLNGYNVLAGWETDRVIYEWSLTEVPGGTYTAPDSLATWKGQTGLFRRAGWSGVVSALRMPLSDGLNARRITTIASLFAQRLAGDRKKGSYRP